MGNEAMAAQTQSQAMFSNCLIYVSIGAIAKPHGLYQREITFGCHACSQFTIASLSFDHSFTLSSLSFHPLFTLPRKA